MAVHDSLKSLVRQNIKTNGQNEITGQILQNVLIAMIDELGITIDPTPTKNSSDAVSSGGTFGALQQLNEINATLSGDGKIYNNYQAGDIYYTEQNSVRVYWVALADGEASEENPVTISDLNFYHAENATDAVRMSLSTKTFNIDAYTKQESDAKYQPKGNYQPAGDYATEQQLAGKANASDVYTKQESDAKYQPKGNYQPAGDYATEQQLAGKANASDVYTKSETYSKAELDNLITTPNQQYVSVTATAQTTAITDLLPATGAADTIYRVGNWDGTQYDPTMYALFAWNGTTYVCLAVRSFVGEVYDVSVNHPDGQGNPTHYADLTAALGTDGANIPADIRRGGMSIKFIQGTVQSSDNKYVQFRLMSNSFSTAISDWQGVDEEPVFGSKNLAMSGGVITLTDNLTGSLDSIIDRTIEDKKQLTSGYTYIHCPIRKGNSYLISNSSDSAAIFAIVTSNDASWTTVESLGQFDVSQSKIFTPTLDAEYFAVYALGNSYITIKTIGSLAEIESSLISIQKELLLEKLFNDYDSLENAGKLLKSSDGTLDTVANYKTSDYISIVGYDRIQYSELFPVVSGWCGLCLYDKNKIYIGTPMVSTNRNGEVNLANYPNAVFMRFSPYAFSVAFSVELLIDSESSVRKLSKRIDDIDAKISESYDIIISKNGGGDYTSLLEGVKNAVLKPHQKVLVKKGSYDIVQEFDAYYGEGALENNSTIFGIILENNVDITFEQEALVVYHYNGSNDFNLHEFSPFHVGTAGNGFTIRNLQLNASNCRYCIHDDSNLQSRAYTNKYINCSLKLDNSGNARGYRQCIGGGFGMNGNIIIEGCYFESVNASDDIVSWHNYSANNAHSQLRLHNCFFYGNTTFRLSWYGTSTLITRAMVSGNSFGVDVIHRAENSSSLVENTELIKWNNEIRSN